MIKRSVWLFVLFAPLLAGASWIRDDAGVPSAQCAFIGSSGNPTLCSPSNPLPTSAGTTSTTDPGGWGQLWFVGTATPATQNRPIYAWPETENQYIGVSLAEVGTTVDLWNTTTKGRTWTPRLVINFSGVGWVGVHFLYRLTSGDYLVGGNCGGGVTPVCTGLGRMDGDGTNSQMALPGLPAGLSGGMASLVQQGTTVLGTWVRSVDSTAFRCRSTDAGVSFTCDGASFGTTNIATGKVVDSPGTNIWIRSRTGVIERSIDNGVSFATAASGLGTDLVLECLSTTVCLATDSVNSVYRSTNAGASWSLVFTAPGANAFSGFLDYGSDVVGVVPGAASRTLFLSRNAGATWLPVFTFGADPQRCLVPCQTLTSNGAAVFSASPVANTDKIMYSPTIGAGQAQIVGVSGVPLNLDAAGNPTVNQGLPGGTDGWYVRQSTVSVPTIAPWSVSPVQGFSLFNSRAVSAANTAVSITITGAANVRSHLYKATARCSAGTASLTVVDGATTIWDTAAAEVGAVNYEREWSTGLTATTGNNLVVTLGACGAANTGTLAVQGDRF